MTDNAPGWRPDPTGRFEHRYWDGSRWTDNVANAGVASNDPYEASTAAGLEDTSAADTPTEAGAGDPTVVGAPADEPGTGWAAPTAAQPTTPTDQTAAWPTSPPPPSFPPSSGPPPVASPGGSKRSLLVGAGILAVVVLAIGAFLLLGGDDEDDQIRTDLVAGLRDEGLSLGHAECLADAIIDEVGAEELDGEDFSSKPDAVSDGLLAQSLEACDIDEQALGGGGDEDDEDSTTTTAEDVGGDDEVADDYGDDPALDALYDDCEDGDMAACDELYFASDVDSGYEAFGETCGDREDGSTAGFCDAPAGGTNFDPGEVPDGFADMFSGMGLTEEQTQCLMDKFSEMDPNIDPDESMGTAFGIFEDCGIDPSELSGG